MIYNIVNSYLIGSFYMKKMDFCSSPYLLVLLCIIFATATILLAYVHSYTEAAILFVFFIFFLLALLDKSDSLLKIEITNSIIRFFYMENKHKSIKTFYCCFEW